VDIIFYEIRILLTDRYDHLERVVIICHIIQCLLTPPPLPGHNFDEERGVNVSSIHKFKNRNFEIRRAKLSNVWTHQVSITALEQCAENKSLAQHDLDLAVIPIARRHILHERK